MAAASPSADSSRGFDIDQLVERSSLELRIAPALLSLALQRSISWDEARWVLDAIEFYDERDARRHRAVWRLLGGQP